MFLFVEVGCFLNKDLISLFCYNFYMVKVFECFVCELYMDKELCSYLFFNYLGLEDMLWGFINFLIEDFWWVIILLCINLCFEYLVFL